MFPYRRVPNHITALYVFEVINFLILFHIAVVQGDVIVISPENQTVTKIADFPASFGPPIPEDGIKGVIVYSNPADACTPISPPPSNLSHGLQWIALIKRTKNGCNFDKKVLMAQKAGYHAAIIHNVHSNNIEPMGPNKDGGKVNISSIFIGEDDGMELQKNFAYGSGFTVIITADVPDFPFNIDIDKYLVPFICVLGVCFLTTILTVIVKCIRDHRRTRRHRLSNRQLRKLPVRKFQKGDQYDTCAICLDEYIEGEKLRELPCSHVYHTKCIDPWLTRNKRTCPVCKRKVLPPGTEVNSDSDQDSDDEGSNETTPLLRSGGAALPTNGSTFSHVPDNRSIEEGGVTNPWLSDEEEAEGAVGGVEEEGRDDEMVRPGTSQHVVMLTPDRAVNVDTNDCYEAAQEPAPRPLNNTPPAGPVEIGIDVATQQRRQQENSEEKPKQQPDMVV